MANISEKPGRLRRAIRLLDFVFRSEMIVKTATSVVCRRRKLVQWAKESGETRREGWCEGRRDLV